MRTRLGTRACWQGRVLLLPWRGNILYFHSEAVARMSGRKPAFLLMPVGVQLIPAMAGESPREFGEHSRSGRAGGALGRAGSSRRGMESGEAEIFAGLHRPLASAKPLSR